MRLNKGLTQQLLNLTGPCCYHILYQFTKYHHIIHIDTYVRRRLVLVVACGSSKIRLITKIKSYQIPNQPIIINISFLIQDLGSRI